MGRGTEWAKELDFLLQDWSLRGDPARHHRHLWRRLQATVSAMEDPAADPVAVRSSRAREKLVAGRLSDVECEWQIWVSYSIQGKREFYNSFLSSSYRFGTFSSSHINSNSFSRFVRFRTFPTYINWTRTPTTTSTRKCAMTCCRTQSRSSPIPNSKMKFSACAYPTWSWRCTGTTRTSTTSRATTRTTSQKW